LPLEEGRGGRKKVLKRKKRKKRERGAFLGAARLWFVITTIFAFYTKPREQKEKKKERLFGKEGKKRKKRSSTRPGHISLSILYLRLSRVEWGEGETLKGRGEVNRGKPEIGLSLTFSFRLLFFLPARVKKGKGKRKILGEEEKREGRDSLGALLGLAL